MREYIKYQEQVLKTGMEEALTLFKKHLFLHPAYIGANFFALILINREPQSALNILFIEFLALFIMAFVLLIFAVIKAPYKIYITQKAKIDELEKRLKAIKGRPKNSKTAIEIKNVNKKTKHQ
jgi:glucan phosphoethanolaminetransferase (alkaline phosphatase superfamily)